MSRVTYNITSSASMYGETSKQTSGGVGAEGTAFSVYLTYRIIDGSGDGTSTLMDYSDSFGEGELDNMSMKELKVRALHRLLFM